MKRLRKPVMKVGELRMFWGREYRQAPEIMYAYCGDTTMRRDMHLLWRYLDTQHPDPHVQPLYSKMQPSLLEELEARGYDLTTLKFSIKKKEPIKDE